MTTRRLRVLTIGHSYIVGLNRALVREVARDPDFDVTVAAPNFFHGDLRDLNLDLEPSGSNLHLVGLDAKRSKHIHIFRYDDAMLKKVLLDGHFDVVHAWEEPYIYAGYQIARCLRGSQTPFCFRTAQNYLKRYLPPFGYFERATLARAQGWIAGASLVREAMLRRGYPAESGSIIPLAVDLGMFKPLDEESQAAVRREVDLDGPIIGFAGRLTAAKGLDLLMQALEMIKPTTRWSLLLLGSGPYEEKIKSWASSKNWGSRVRVKLVTHREMPRFMGALDLLLAPSQTTHNWREQFGRMLIEAFACGVPVIGSDSGEIPRVIGDAGLVVKEDDAHAWAEAINDLLRDETARRELARKGLERVQQFSVSAVATKYKDYYRWLSDQQCS